MFSFPSCCSSLLVSNLAHKHPLVVSHCVCAYVCVSQGVSNMDNIEKMKNLSNTRILEIRQCLEVTHCIRQNWINTQQPTITQLLDTYPKFCILPELVWTVIKATRCKSAGLYVLARPLFIFKNMKYWRSLHSGPQHPCTITSSTEQHSLLVESSCQHMENRYYLGRR